MTFYEHLEELRWRIIYSLALSGVLAFISYFYMDALLEILIKPVGKVVFLEPSEAFFTRIKLSLYCGLFFALPFILYQGWEFTVTALTVKEKRMLLKIVPASYLLFSAGLLFSITLVIPSALKFLTGFSSSTVVPMLSFSKYISFIFIFAAGFGIIFQLPVVSYIAGRMGIISSGKMRGTRRYAIVVIFIVAGLITPGPDIFSQFAMAVPTLLLYELSILIVKAVERSPNG